MADIRVLDEAPDGSSDSTHGTGCGCCEPTTPSATDEELRRLEAMKAELDRRLSTLEGTS